MEIYGGEAFKLTLMPLGCKYLYRPKYLPLESLLLGQYPHALRKFEERTSTLLHMKSHLCLPKTEEALSWGFQELLKSDFSTLNHLLCRHLKLNPDQLAALFRTETGNELPAKDDPLIDLSRKLYRDFITRITNRGDFLAELHGIVTHPAGPFRSLEEVQKAVAELTLYDPTHELYLVNSPKLWLDITSEGTRERFIITKAGQRYQVIKLTRRGYDKRSLEELEFYRMSIRHFKDAHALAEWLQIPSEIKPLQVIGHRGYQGGFTVSGFQHVSLLNFRYSSLAPTDWVIRLYAPPSEAGRAVYHQYFDDKHQHYSFCYMQEAQLNRRAKELGIKEEAEGDEHRINIAKAALDKLQDLELEASFIREPSRMAPDRRAEILELETLACRSLAGGLYHPDLNFERVLMPRILYSQEAYRPLNPFKSFKKTKG